MGRVLFLLLMAMVLFGKEEVRELYYKSYDYERMGAYKEAIKALMPLYGKYPRGYTLNLRLGWLFYLDGRYANAIEHYKRAALSLPGAVEPKLGLARVYLAMKRYGDLHKEAATIVRGDPYNYYGNYYLALAQLGLGKEKEARATAHKMLRLYPVDVGFLTLFARSYKRSDPEYARRIYEDILILDPNNVEAREFVQ